MRTRPSALGLLDALGEDPDLALGIRRSETAVSYWRRLQLGHVGTGGFCPVMKSIDVVDVEVDQYRWISV